jgi:hypothetical protein
MTLPSLRPLSVGEIIDQSFGLYRRHFGPLFMVAMVTNGLPLLLNIYITSAGGVLANIPLSLAYLALAIVLSAVATVATVFIVSESYLGRSITAGLAFDRAMPFIGRVIVLSILSPFVVLIGLLLVIVPGIILAGGLFLGPLVLVVENSADAIAAMRRSFQLSRGYRGKLWGLICLLGLLIIIPIVALGFLAALVSFFFDLEMAGNATFDVIATAVTGVVQIVIYPLFYCALTIAYYDVRVRKEGFDLEVLSGALQAG